MKLKNPLLVVADLERSLTFYKQVLGLRVVMDFGANVTLTGGLCLQTADSWKALTGLETFAYGGNVSEVYFEENRFDVFVKKLARLDVSLVHPPLEHPWGQRVVRFYDPDRHIVEVGENMKAVCCRFLDGGMSPEQTAQRMDVPLKFVMGCLK